MIHLFPEEDPTQKKKTRSQRSSQPSRNAFQHLKPDGYAKEPSRRGCSLLVAGVGDGIGFLARKNY